MKTKFLFIALALPAIFAACSNEEFENEVLQKDGREFLSKDFSIIAEKSITPLSRGEWNRLESEEGTVTYQFNWINRTKADHIGLCWTGGATAADLTDVSVANPSNMALSNYDFQLTGYKYLADEEDEELTLETYDAASLAGFETEGNDYRTAEFKVTGVTPLTGEYVMYYPYSAELKNVGYIPTSVEAVQTIADVDSVAQLQKFGNATLCISDPYQFASSDAAANVTLSPYTTGFMPKIFLAEDATPFDLSRIMIVAKDGKEIINEQTLDLKRNVKTSTGVNTMTVNLPANTEINNSYDGGLKVLMAMLPQTLKKDDVEILFVNSESMAYTLKLTNDLVLRSGVLRTPNVTLDPEDFKTYIITDATALEEAINRVSTAAATINTYKNVPVNFDSDADFTNTKKATVGAEKIVFKGNVTFGGDIEFTCPVEFKGSVTIASGKTVTLADGTKFSTGASLGMNAGTSNATTTLNLKATDINVSLAPTSNVYTAINFVSGTSNLNAALTVGENLVVNVKSGAVVNVKVEAALVNNGTVNVEAGATVNVASYVAENTTVTPSTPEINPSISNIKTLVIKGTVNNDNIIDNTGLISTDGAGLINNNKTINNNANGKITMYQSSGVVINQATGAVVNDAGSISGVTRINGGEIIAIPATFSDASLTLAQYAYHTAFKVTAVTTLTNLNTTKKLILAQSLTINSTDEDVTSLASGPIVVADDATLTSNKSLNISGDVTINSDATLTIGEATVVAVSGKVINNGTFGYTNEANSNVTCTGIQSGTGATWTHYPQWF